MKRSLIRFFALLAVTAMAAMLFTGCLLPMSNASRPSIDADDSASTTPYEEREPVFMQNVQQIQVNLETAVGFFCYKDNPLRILTPDTKTEEHDDSIEYTVTVFETEKGKDPVAVSEDKYQCELRKDGYLYLKSSVIGELVIEGKGANGNIISPVKIAIVGKSITFWDIIILGIGVYLIFAAIIGKGRLYENDFVREGMEAKHKKIIRITALVVGLMMVASVVLSALDKYDQLRYVKLGLFGAMLIAFIICMLLLRGCVDQEKKKEAMQQGYAGGKPSTSAAFEFDENEPTVDDIMNNKKDE